MGIAKGPYAFPLLLVTEDGLAIHENRFRPNETDAVFGRRWQSIGATYRTTFPVDVDSESWEFAELVIRKILELMGNGEAVFCKATWRRQSIVGCPVA